MDLGIKGKSALVCAASKGLGRACAMALGREGVALTIVARTAGNPAGRFGDPEEFGAACAFLCAEKSGFITGQNLLLDGGAFPGTL